MSEDYIASLEEEDLNRPFRGHVPKESVNDFSFIGTVIVLKCQSIMWKPVLIRILIWLSLKICSTYISMTLCLSQDLLIGKP